MSRENTVADLLTNDIIGHFKPLLRQGGGWRVNEDTHKIEPVMKSAGWDHPWIYLNQDDSRKCILQQLFFNAFKAIPRRCLKCWKIVVMPRTVVELFDLLDLEEELGYDSKCGTEVREFVGRNYGGYFYTESLLKGKDRYNEVRSKVSERISPEVPVILKRYCTEFELQKGPSKAYNRPKGADHWEDLFFNSFSAENTCPPQPEIVKTHVKRGWIEFAWQRGDMSVKELNNGEPLYSPYDTYHEEKK